MLDRQPMAALEQIYNGLELDGFENAAPRFRAYLEGVKSFRKNAFQGDARAVGMVSDALGHWIGKWGYEAPAPAPARMQATP
jgi:hypothetical protein